MARNNINKAQLLSLNTASRESDDDDAPFQSESDDVQDILGEVLADLPWTSPIAPTPPRDTGGNTSGNDTDEGIFVRKKNKTRVEPPPPKPGSENQ